MIGKTLGKYRVVERLGRGGMGTVYKAIDETLDREVAIKVLNADLDDSDILKRFRGEAVTLARLNHPGIATIYELYRDDDRLLMVMEFVRGETVHDFAERVGPVAPPQAAHLAMQVLDALSHAHRGGVVHRDLKPANLMITETGAVKVMDFGIARVLGTERYTHGGYMMGTPAYMAPEQVLGGEVDGRADLYAVGVLLYRLLTGQLPFNADTAIAMVQKQVNDQPIPIADIAPNLPRWCTDVMARALAKSPADRYQTADEFRAALLSAVQPQALGELPTMATPAPPGLMIAGDLTRAHPPTAYAPMMAGAITSGEIRSRAAAAVATASAPAPSSAAIPVPTPTGTKALDRTTTTVVLGRNHLFALGGLFLVLIAGVGILSFAALRRNILPPQFQFSSLGSAPATSAPSSPPPGNASAQPAGSPISGSSPSTAASSQATPAAPAETRTGAPSTTPAAPAGTIVPNAGAQKPSPPPVPGAKTAATGGVATVGSVPSATKPDGRGAVNPTDSAANAGGAAARGARGAQPTPPAGTPATSATTTPPPPATPPAPPAAPHASSLPPISFKDVRVLVSAGGKTSEVSGVMTLGDGRLQVNGKDSGSALVSLPYYSISAAYYSRSKQPKWKDAEGKEVEGKADLGKLGFLRSDRNWLILLSNGAPIVMRFDDSDLKTILPALQDRAGVKIQR